MCPTSARQAQTDARGGGGYVEILVNGHPQISLGRGTQGSVSTRTRHAASCCYNSRRKLIQHRQLTINAIATSRMIAYP